MSADATDKIRDIGRTRSGLRYGWTTGSCAAAAAKASAEMFFGQETVQCVQLMTPKGISLVLDVEKVERTSERTKCAVRKFSGDDPDVTDGLLVYAQIESLSDREAEKASAAGAFCVEENGSRGLKIILDGGIGIGRVTKRGLEQDIGQAAINKTPRRMIVKEVVQICRKYGFTGNLKVTVSIPEGEKTARKTFNPRLGIQGGLSVLGTSGIVEPMSEKALTDTIWLEMKMLRESGCDTCCVVPGNYGSDFLSGCLGLNADQAVKCSNYVGETIDDGVLLGMKGMLLVGHVGKFIKLAAGVMNTHSRQADCRMEVLAAHAAMAGADTEMVIQIMSCLNTAEAMKLLKQNKLLDTVMCSVMQRIVFYLKQRAGDNMQIGVIVFSCEEGILAQTENASQLMETVRRQQMCTDS